MLPHSKELWHAIRDLQLVGAGQSRPAGPTSTGDLRGKVSNQGQEGVSKYQDFVQSESGLAITFRRGKTVKMRKKPYTVTTRPGAFEKYLDLSGPPNEFLFYSESPKQRRELLKEMVRALKVENPDLESKSIRRGSLQHMAKNGVPANVLMTFSGHGSVDMLKVYLGFGVLLEDEAKRQRAAAQHLLAEGATLLEDSL